LQVDILLARVGEVEDEVFRRKKAVEDREQQRRNRGNNGSNPKRVSGKTAVVNEGRAILEHIRKTNQTVAVAGRDNRDQEPVNVKPLAISSNSSSSSSKASDEGYSEWEGEL
jgi:5'-3' exonuclease